MAPLVPLDAPNPEVYAREAIRDPHQTPLVLRQFAQRMAERMERAFVSEPDAVDLAAELSECALKDGGVESVRAVCAVNYGRLAGAFPERLGRGYSELRERLPKPLVDSVEASGF